MSDQKKMALIASQGTLDWAYPPFILASTAAALDMEVQMFFTFYGLTLLKKEIKAKVAPATNPAMLAAPSDIRSIEFTTPPLICLLDVLMTLLILCLTSSLIDEFVNRNKPTSAASSICLRSSLSPCNICVFCWLNDFFLFC